MSMRSINKKILIMSLILILIINYISIAPAKNVISINKTIYVNDEGFGDYTKIQDAINNATDGDTIFVDSGTYFEHLLINKTINLIGENKKTTIIDGNSTKTVIYISADKVTISGFTIQNSGFYFYSGIHIDSNDNNISENIIKNNNWGVFITGSSNNSINSNIIHNNFVYGLYLSIANNNTISKNKIIKHNGDGIYLRFSSNNSIDHNIIKNNGVGIVLQMFSDNNTISYNTLLINRKNGYFEDSTSFWYQNFWNRPRIFPKLIIGRITQNGAVMLKISFDWNPLLKPFCY